MKVRVEKLDKHKMVLEMEIPEDEVAKAVNKAYHKLANQVNIPGFRKGKAPRGIVERRVGKEALLNEAFDIIAPTAYNQALTEQSIEPVSRPQIEVVTLQEDKPLVFKATVTARPQVTLGSYKGVKVTRGSGEVTDADIDAELQKLRERHARVVVAEGEELKTGDFAILDFEGFIDGQPFAGGNCQTYPLEIGSGTFIPGFEEQLIGAKAGEEREVKATFPADYHAEQLAGKDAVFKVKIQDIKHKELPELDDEFAKEASKFDTLEELKTDLRNKLEKTAKDKAEQKFRNEAIKAVVDSSEVDIPDIMVEGTIDNFIKDFEYRLDKRNMKLIDYMNMAKLDRESLREQFREAAVSEVKTGLVLDEIIKTENIMLAPEKLNKEIDDMA